jgi:hypothetical protein
VAFHEPPDELLAAALADFERQFNYPLGPGRSFRIEHGADYARFYRAMGEARCLVRRCEGRVLGVLCAALRSLGMSDGSEQPAVYIGDLKVAPEARAGRTLYRLARETIAWASPRVDVAFGVVMDGTAVLPARYTGRAGIPRFDVVGHVMIYRLAGLAPAPDWTATEAAVRECFRELSAGRFACPAGTPGERSRMRPVWLLSPDGSACGCLEDTRRAKRLIADDGEELVSAHLSCFAYRDVRAAAGLLSAALGLAREMNYPALFAAVDGSDVAGLDPLLPSAEVVRAPATVFGHGLAPGAWVINTSEI